MKLPFFGPCAVCAAKDETIASLKSEIEFLRLQVRPKTEPSFEVELEANAVMDGRTDPIEVLENGQTQEEIDSEAQRILSGTY